MVEITIASRGSEIIRVSDFLDRLAAEHHLPRGIVSDMHVALDEVLTNITKYAHAENAEREIQVRLDVRDDLLEAMIEDGGAPFDPLAAPAPDVSAPLRERRVGGVGIHFVRNLMDEVIYNRSGERNRLLLRKRFKA